MLNVGEKIPAFVESDTFSGFMQPNPKLIQRYFPDSSMAPDVSPDTVYFNKVKPHDSFRIVIQGGSTAAGFPYGRFGSLQGMLQQRFKRLYPRKNIEIINTAMAAVNTYTLLDIADEIVELEPDLVLIYSGHNEYLGVLGVGSSVASKGGRFATLTYLWLKQFRLYQLLESVYFNLVLKDNPDSQSHNDVKDKRTLMSHVAKGQTIPFESDLFQLGVEQFKGNLTSITDIYRENDIPVLVGNLVSIESGLIPFSINQKFDQIVQEGLCDLESGFDVKSDCVVFNQYMEAQKLLNDGKFTEARRKFIKSKDLDALRFRAPSIFNQVIKQLTEQPNTYLVDVETAFLQDSSHGIINHDYMLEHVHPTVRGYFVLAEAFISKIVELDLLHQPIIPFTVEQAWSEIPITYLDKLYGNVKIDALTKDFPFNKAEHKPLLLDENSFIYPYLTEKLKGEPWLALQNKLMKAYQQNGEHLQAARVAGIIVDALPLSTIGAAEQANLIAGQLYMKVQDYALAQYYQQRALSLNPTNSNYILILAQSAFLNEEFEYSLDLLKQAKQLDPTNTHIQFFIDRVSLAIKARGH